jgi:peptide/nickel transport system substrate-binding protein
MKRTVGVLVVTVLALVLVAGLAFAGGKTEGPAKEPEKTSAAGPARGGTLVASVMTQITSMDPPNGNAFTGEGHVYLAIYSRLLRKDESGEFVPDLAKSWEFSADGKQLTFKLREGIKFHDGTPFNAEAAKWNLDRLLDPKDATQAYQLFTDLDSVTAVDPYTVRLNLKRPSAVVLDALTYRGGFMISPTAFKTYGEDYNQHPTGTGPFKFLEWIPNNRCVVVRNENYWEMGEDGKPLPYLDQITLKQIIDDSVRVVELQTGNVAMVDRIPAESMDIIRGDANLDLVRNPTATTFRLYLNMRRPPFNNLKLRQAINYAFDRQAMADALVPGQGSVNPFLYLPSERYYSTYTPYSYDPAKAKKLLAEAGYPNGLDVGFMMIAREPDVTIAPVVQSYLQEIGIRTEIQPLDRLIYVDKAAKGDFDMSMAQITLPLPSIYLTLQQQIHSKGPVNRAAWNNPDFDATLDQLSVTFDVAKQNELLAKAQKICLDDAGQTFLFTRDGYDGKVKGLKGIVYQSEGTWLLTRAWLEK